MLFMVILYCITLDCDTVEDIAYHCRNDRIIQIVTCGKTPSALTFTRFFKESDPFALKVLFLYSIVRLNDYNYVNFIKLYIDSTDALVHGSMNYMINEDKIKAFELLKKYELIHDNTKASIKRLLNGLNEIKKEFPDDEEIEKMIRLVQRNVRIFNWKVYEKIPQFEQMMEERNVKQLSISFPEAVKMPTKKGGFDIAFNIHQIMTGEKIVLSGIISDKPNDVNCLEEIMEEFAENLSILVKIQKEYGERRNYKEIQNIINGSTFIMDGGYFEIQNIITSYNWNMHILMMPRLISRKINETIRKDNNITDKKKKKKTTTKKSLKRVKNGYICPNGEKIELTKTIKLEKQDETHKDLPTELQVHRYTFQCNNCENCPNKDECTVQTIKEERTPLEHEMINKFTNKRYLKIFNKRFHCSEGINGYLKRKNGVLYFMASNKTAAQNELNMRNLCYNITRFVKLKGTLY